MKRGLKNSGVIRTEWEPQVSEEITKLDECDERLYYSPSVKIGGFIWRFTIDYVITAAESPTPYLAIFVHCSHEDNNIDWTCWATSEFKIISHSPQPADVSRRSDEPDFYTSEESKGWGYNEFIVWKDLEKYTKNGVITIEVRIVVSETYGSFFSSADLIESNANIRIKQARDNEIEYKLFYVNKEYLMEYSNYFKAVFNRDFEEKKNMCVELEDVDPQDFDQLLQVISPQRKPLTKENIEKILKLADRFEIIDVLYLAGRFLIKGRNKRNEDQMDPFDRLILADKYQLHWSIKDIVADARLDADDLLGNEKYEVLTHKTKVEILEEIAMPHKRTRNIEVIRPFYSFYILDSEINYIKVNARINCKCNEICQCEHMRLKSFYVNKGILLSYSEYFEDKIKFPLMTNQVQSDKTKVPPRRTRKSHLSISDEPGPSAKKSKMDASDKDILIEETIAPFITADEFEELLRVIYPSRKRITDENIKILLKLANILRMPDVIDYCEDFLISQLSKIGVAYSLLELIIFADEYELKELMKEILKILNTFEIRAMRRELKYANLKHETKSLLFDRLVELL
uniref:BTB domain-containing protein n=1 Tax=Acrobeloides nanus TaxID=290746 RepID=A0A914EDG7_9BILA